MRDSNLKMDDSPKNVQELQALLQAKEAELRERSGVIGELRSQVELLRKEGLEYMSRTQDSRIELERRTAEFEERARGFEEALREREGRIRERDGQLARVVQSSEEKVKEAQAAQSELTQLKLLLATAQTSRAKAEEELEKMRERLLKLEREREEESAARAELKARLDRTTAELTEVKGKLAAAGLELEHLKTEAINLKAIAATVAEKEALAARLRAENEALGGVRDAQALEIKRLVVELSDAQTTIQKERVALKMAVDAEKERAEQFRRDLGELAVKLAVAEQGVIARQEELAVMKHKLAEGETRIALLRVDVNSSRNRETAHVAAIRLLEGENLHLKKLVQSVTVADRDLKVRSQMQVERVEKERRKTEVEKEKLKQKDEAVLKREACIKEKEQKAEQAISILATRDKAILALSKKLESVQKERDSREQAIRGEWESKFNELKAKFEQLGNESKELSEMLKNANRMYEMKVGEVDRLRNRFSKSEVCSTESARRTEIF